MLGQFDNVHNVLRLSHHIEEFLQIEMIFRFKVDICRDFKRIAPSVSLNLDRILVFYKSRESVMKLCADNITDWPILLKELIN